MKNELYMFPARLLASLDFFSSKTIGPRLPVLLVLAVLGCLSAIHCQGQVLFQDNFNTGSLNPAWSLVRSNATYYTCSSTGLVLRCNSGDLYETANNALNVFVITNPAPGDFTVTAKLRWLVPPPTPNYAQFALLAYDDDDNYVRAYYGYVPAATGFYLATEVLAVYTGGASANLNLGGSDFWLQYRKQGFNYTEWYSVDGTNFAVIGPAAAFPDGDPTKLGFVAMVDASESAEVLVESFNVQGVPPASPGPGLVYQPVSLAPVVNDTNNRIANCPTGSVVLAGVPFNLLPMTGSNDWDAAMGTVVGVPSAQVMNLPVNLFGATAMDTLINTSWGNTNSPPVALSFYCSDGSSYTNTFAEGIDIRDWLQGDYVNTAASTNTVQVYSAPPISPGTTTFPWGRIDKQHVVLPPAFASRTITNIVLTDNGVTGTGDLAYSQSVNAQRAFIYGLTATVAQPNTQTYTWDQHALGQEYLHCYNVAPEYWPNNPDWTQTYTTSGNCDGSAIVESAPSNWDPPPPVGLYPGGPGLQGVNVIIGGLVNGTNIAGGANTYLEANVTVNNLTLQTNGSLNINFHSSLTATNVDIQGDTIIGPGQYAGSMYVAAGGSLTKSGGTGVLGFSMDQYGNPVNFQAVNSSLVVKSGTFAMPYNGGGYWFGGTFSVSNNATVILNVTNNSECVLGGNITGVGGGTVVMTATVLTGGTDFYGTHYPGLTLDFPGNMFQWSGGAFYGGSPVTNNGVMNLTNGPEIYGVTLYNDNLIKLADNSTFYFDNNYNSILDNDSGGTFDIQGNSGLSRGGGIYNYGLFIKSAGTGASQILPIFVSYGGTIEADSGTLDLNVNGAGYYTNTTFVVSNGAAIDFLTNNYTVEIEGTLTGSGGGTFLMNNGTVFCYNNATLNFPGAMFQWQGGSLGGYTYSGYRPLTNAGTLNVSGPVGIDGSIANNGAMIQSGAGGISGGYALFNGAGAVYDIQNDNGLAIGNIFNYGLIKKSAGTGTSTVSGFANQAGSVEVDSGTLSLSPAYVQGGGMLIIHLGGSGAGQSGLLSVSGSATLGGPLIVTLTNGYAPAIGTQIQIVSGNPGGSTFSTLNVPPGISVTYSNTGVYLTVTSAVPAQLLSPQVASGNFSFNFGTATGQSYTVLQNTNLATTNWTFYTNITGNGSLYQLVTPATNHPQQFFRVSEP